MRRGLTRKDEIRRVGGVLGGVAALIGCAVAFEYWPKSVEAQVKPGMVVTRMIEIEPSDVETEWEHEVGDMVKSTLSTHKGQVVMRLRWNMSYVVRFYRGEYYEEHFKGYELEKVK